MNHRIIYLLLFLNGTSCYAMSPKQINDTTRQISAAIQARQWNNAQRLINLLSEGRQQAIAAKLQRELEKARRFYQQAEEQTQAKRAAQERERAQAERQKAETDRSAQEAARKREEAARAQAEKRAAEEKRLRDEAQQAAAQGRDYTNQLLKTIQERDAQINQLTDNLNKNVAAHDVLRNQIADLEHNYQVAQKHINDLQKQTAGIAQGADQELRTRLNEANKANQNLQAQLGQMESKSKEDINQALQRSEQLFNERFKEAERKAQENEQALRKEITDLKRVQAAPPIPASLPVDRQRIQELEDANTRAKETEQALRKQIEELKKSVGSPAQQAQLSKQMQAQADRAFEQNRKLQATNKELENIVEKALNEIKDRDITLKTKDEQINDLQAQVRKLKDQIDELELASLDEQAAMSALKDANQFLGEKLEQARALLEKMLSAYGSISSEEIRKELNEALRILTS